MKTIYIFLKVILKKGQSKLENKTEGKNIPMKYEPKYIQGKNFNIKQNKI